MKKRRKITKFLLEKIEKSRIFCEFVFLVLEGHAKKKTFSNTRHVYFRFLAGRDQKTTKINGKFTRQELVTQLECGLTQFFEFFF